MTPPANIVIRIDAEVYGHLKSRAEPFTDTPNMVLRRVLGLEIEVPEGADDAEVVEEGRVVTAANRRSRRARIRRRGRRQRGLLTRAAPGSILRSEEYIDPLLKVLEDAGGSAPVRQVMERLGKDLNGLLTPKDLETLPSGAIRWQNRVQFVRLQLVQEGLIAKDSPRGFWTLTDAGQKRVRGST